MTCVVHRGQTSTGPLLSLASFPLPDQADLAQGEVLLALEGATLCNSDLHTLAGRRKEPCPAVLGHEGCGTVVASRRPGVPPGTRLTFSVTDTCGECALCRGGPRQKCMKLKKYGHSLHTEGTVPVGTYSSHILLGPGTELVVLPPGLDTALAVPANCALATVVAARRAALHALQKYPGTGQKRLLVYGGGLLGLYACSLFLEEGFQVYLSDPVARRREQAALFGAEGVAGPGEVAVRQYDVVLEVCGVGAVVKPGLAALRPGGVLVLVGCVTPDSALGITGDEVVRKCATITGVHNYGPEDLREGVAFLDRCPHKQQFRDLVSPPVPLSQFEAALGQAREGSFQRVLLDCTK